MFDFVSEKMKRDNSANDVDCEEIGEGTMVNVALRYLST